MSEVFINPYTFIPVNNGKKQEYGSHFKGELLSGKISCTLRTKTQIAVCDDTDISGTKEFFSIDGKTPVIPGSEIRGVIRSIFEALTDSCLSSVNAEDDDYFSSRMNKTNTGVLVKENGRYKLYKAESYIDKKGLIPGKLFTGCSCYFELENGEIKNVRDTGDNKDIGYVLRSDRFRGKYHNRIFTPNLTAPVHISDEELKAAVIRLEENIKKYKTADKEVSEWYSKAFKNMKNDPRGEKYLPVWYTIENGHCYLAPSQVSRSIYFKRPIDLLKKQDLNKCESKSEICEACSVFGILNDNGDGFAVPSRLRFSDAVYDEKSRKDSPFDKIYRLPVLEQPRISSFEFYLSNPEMSFGADDEGTYIAGRKYYWHNNKKRITADSTVGKENMVSRVHLLKEGTEFKFEIFFDKITEEMLRKLVFAVNLGENDIYGTQCHKLGYGKPIGLGSVKIIADSITVRRFADGNYSETDITSIVSDPNNSTLFVNTDVEDVLRVTNFNAVDGNLISYPSVIGGTNIFEWFAENRERFKKGKTKPIYKKKLPTLRDEIQTLEKPMGRSKKNNQGKNPSGYHK